MIQTKSNIITDMYDFKKYRVKILQLDTNVIQSRISSSFFRNLIKHKERLLEEFALFMPLKF